MSKKSIFDNYAVDIKAEKEGVWVSLVSAPEAQIKVKSAQAKEFKRYLHSANMKNARILNKEKKTFDETELLEKTLAETAVKHLLLDWSGFIGEEGKEIKFSVSKALEVLLDPRMRNLLDEVVEVATTPETFKSDDEEVDAEEAKGLVEKN